MAEMKKYLDTTALGTLVDKIKEADAKVLTDAKAYADGLASNYDAAGAAATVQGNLDTYVASNDAAVALKADKTALEAEVTRAKAAEEANTALINAIKDGANLDSFKDVEDEIAKYQLAGDYAVNGHKHVMADITDLQAALDLKANKSEVEGALALKADKTEVEALAGKVGTVADDTTVVAMIEAVDGKADKNAADIVTINEAIKNIQENAYDDTELRGLISDNADAIEALEGVHATDKAALEAEDARIAGLVSAEAERAAGVEAGLEERLVEVETFFKTAEGEALDEALDTLVELQKYLSDEGAVADQMLLDIAANKKAIEDHAALNHDFAAADATLKSELEGKIALKADASAVEAMDTAYKAADTAIKGRLDVLEAIDHDAYVAADTALENKLNAEIAKKADITALNSAVETLEGADTELGNRITSLEGKVDVEKVSVAISNAIAAQDFSGFTTDAEHEELAGRVTTVEGKVTTLEGKVDVEKVSTAIATAKQEAINEAAADAKSKADQALVDAKAYTDGEIDKVEAAITDLEEASATHALASDLEDAVERIAANESAINSFTPITSGEVEALFA